MNTIHLSIEGMTCGHCTAAVEKALRVIDGVEQVEVSLESGEAVVKGSADLDTLIRAIVEEGYEARGI